MSHLKKVLKWIVNIFTFVLLFILILVIYGKAVLTFTDNMYPNYFGYTLFEVASGSMEPALHVNDVILVKVTREDLKKNDIIAFRSEDAIITHRIVYIDGNVITVKGDHNDTIDKPIVVDQVIGKVVKVYSKLGIWKKVITSPRILALIFVTLLLFDLALSYNGDKKEIKVKEKKKVKEEKVEAKEEKEEVKEEVLFKEVKPKETKKKNVTEADKLLELTRKIDVSEIDKLLEITNTSNNKDIDFANMDEVFKKEPKKKAKQEIKEEPEEEDIKEELRKKNTDYTVRLDLNEIQKKIDKKVR